MITVKAGKKVLHLHTMNEYMAVEDGDGVRVASYPDVIAVLDAEGRPVSAGKLKAGMKVHVFHIHKDKIPLASSVFDPAVYPPVEARLGINLRDYALAQPARKKKGKKS